MLFAKYEIRYQRLRGSGFYCNDGVFGFPLFPNSPRFRNMAVRCRTSFVMAWNTLRPANAVTTTELNWGKAFRSRTFAQKRCRLWKLVRMRYVSYKMVTTRMHVQGIPKLLFFLWILFKEHPREILNRLLKALSYCRTLIKVNQQFLFSVFKYLQRQAKISTEEQ